MTSPAPVSGTPALTTTRERRLLAEWQMLLDLARLNPARLQDLQQVQDGIHLTLHETPAAPLQDFTAWLRHDRTGPAPDDSAAAPATPTDHAVRLHFPRFYPAVPLEAYLDRAVAHPNVHPDNGFVCLWATHRIGNTAEHAVHKLAAILGWTLLSAAPEHSMQPELLPLVQSWNGSSLSRLQQRLHASLLRGILVQEPPREHSGAGKERRRRLDD